MAVLVALYLGVVLLFQGVSTAGYLWTNIRAGNLGLVRERYGRAAWPILRSTLTNTLSLLVAYPLIPVGLLPGFSRPMNGPDTGLPRVVFVHGLIHNASAWIAHRRWFFRAGFTRQSFYTYNSLTRVFSEIEAGLAGFILDEAAKEPGRKVILVGHSLGGLAIRAVLARPEVARVTACAVTMGAPLQGSALALLGLNRLSRSLAFRIKAIESVGKTEISLPLPRLCIYSPVDSIVIPVQGLLPAEPGWHVQATPTPLGHVDLLYSKNTNELALDFIRRNVS